MATWSISSKYSEFVPKTKMITVNIKIFHSQYNHKLSIKFAGCLSLAGVLRSIYSCSAIDQCISD